MNEFQQLLLVLFWSSGHRVEVFFDISSVALDQPWRQKG